MPPDRRTPGGRGGSVSYLRGSPLPAKSHGGRRRSPLASCSPQVKDANLQLSVSVSVFCTNVPCLCVPCVSFFVSPTEKQLQMTGRLWRHGLAMMPHLVAGACGPAEQFPGRHVDVAPARMIDNRRVSSGDHEELEDGLGPDGGILTAAEEVLPDPVVPDVVSSDKYVRLFGTLPLHRAVLDVFCRMAVLGGRLMGDNMAETTRMSEEQMRSLAGEATEFIIEYVDLLFGPAHTTKAHRLANHLLAALLDNGNLWEGDTSENEALHGPCKRMYARTNKRGPTSVLQMMRATETQCRVLYELQGLDSADVEDDEGVYDLLGDVRETGDVEMAPTPVLSRSHRGLRMRVADAEQLPGMTGLGSVLGKDADCSLVVSPSVTFYCTFEWGADPVVQTACATDSYLGKPRYDHVWYTGACGERRLGWARLVVRMLGGVAVDFIVVRRMDEVPSLPNCPLTRSGCKRLAWSFETPDAEWPSLACVPLSSVLRVEHVVPDFEDLGNRHGLRAVPSNTPDTAAERHAERFFTNAFYPFTSRVLNPSS